MSLISAGILGALAASVLWIFALAWLLDVRAAQRAALTTAETRLRLYTDTAARQAQQLADAQTTIRLYRDSLAEADGQVRVLLSQVERLSRRVIDQAADAACAPVLTLPAHGYAMRES
jgi:type IV secretory pathway VirJ component